MYSLLSPFSLPSPRFSRVTHRSHLSQRRYHIVSLSLYLLLLPLTLSILSGCSDKRRISAADSAAIADSVAAAQAAEADAYTEEAWRWADSLLDTMTEEEMAAQLYMPAMYARDTPAEMARLTRYARDMKTGGIVLLKGDLKGAAAICDSLRALTHGGAGYFVAVDAENGLKMRFPDAPEFPWNREIGRLTDDQLMYEFGREIARECREVGIGMVLGPVLDVVPGEGSHNIMRRRSLGSDPKRVADLAVAYARGVEDGGIITVAKHFPGHGAATADSHLTLPEVNNDAARMDSVDLYPFRKYSDELLSGVMVGHLSAPALDSVRRPAIVSEIIMRDILRGRIGFGGLVLTDALNMEGALGVSGWQAIAAGADIVLAPSDTEKEIRLTIEALHDGRMTAETVANRVRRILFFKYLAGIPTAPRLDVDNVEERVKSRGDAISDTIRTRLRSKPHAAANAKF